MKLPALPLSAAAHRRLDLLLSRQVWHIQSSQRYVHSTGVTRNSPDGPQKTQPHPRQRRLVANPRQFRDLETPVRKTPSASAPDIGVDLDTALDQAIMNFKITRPQEAPLLDYTRSSMPPKVTDLCYKFGLSLPHVHHPFHDSRLAMDFTLSKKHCFHDYHVRDIMDPLSPFQDWALDFHVTRHHREPLWLNVIELGGKKVKAVVKSRGAKRAKHAFAEALGRNGYDRRGNPLSERAAREAGATPAPEGLYGTVRVKLYDLKKFCGVPYTDVVDTWERHIAKSIRNRLGVRTGPDGGNAVRKVSSGGTKPPVLKPRKDEQQRRTATGPASSSTRAAPSGKIRSHEGLPEGGSIHGNTSSSEPRSGASRPARTIRPVRLTKVSFI